MKGVTVTFENGFRMTTDINGTDESIRAYYVGKEFNFGDTEEHPADLMIRVVSVEVLKPEQEMDE
jgi:hypothetical protein